MNKYFLSLSMTDWMLILVRFFLGFIFIFSGIVKLLPIESFELKFVEIGLSNWTIAPYLARLIIGVELFLGLMLIFNIKPHFTAISVILLLSFFIGYLIYDLIINGNESNCGCFGTYIKMTPLESILKNSLMIPMAFLLLFLNKRKLMFRLKLMIPIIFLISFSFPFIVYPIDNIESYKNANSEKTGYAFPTELMPGFNIKGDSINLKNGQYIVAFMSVNCSHCRKAAYKLYILNKQKKLPPVYMVLIGTDKLAAEFIKDTKADFPYYLFNENEFFDIAGSSVPKIMYLRNGIVEAKFDNVTLTDESLEKVLKNNL
jgi:uncharacterized membrane protein YphA (DoxX/SURF4 family)